MSSSSPPNTGAVDLESVLNVRRRTLPSIGETGSPHHHYRYTDTIYIKREDNSNSLFTINAKIIIFGELQFLYNIFERHTSNIVVDEDSIEIYSNKLSFSPTFEENESIPEETTGASDIVSKLRQSSISSQSSSPPKISGSPIRRPTLGSIGHANTIGGTTSDYSVQNLDGKRYGSIQLPNMTIIEILEILLRSGLELVNQSSDYDQENTLHQNFILTKTRLTSLRLTPGYHSRSSSFIGT